MPTLMAHGHTAFHVRNHTPAAHELTLRGRSGTTSAQVPPNGSAVMQMLLGAGRHELLCTVPGHAERAAFDTYDPGTPLNTTSS